MGDLHAVKSVLSSFSGGGGGPGGGGEASAQQESNSQKKNPSDQNTDTVSALVNFAPNGANTCNNFIWTSSYKCCHSFETFHLIQWLSLSELTFFCVLVLFKASENGHKEVVSHLIAAGADGRIHPVTKYSPLYIG